MEYRKLFNDETKTSLLGVGCMRFPCRADGSIDTEAVDALVKAAFDGGVNYFDTAYNYQDCKNEAVVGDALSKYPRDSYYVATKMPPWFVKTAEDAERVFNEQLAHLRTDHIDFYLLHSMDRATYDRFVEIGVVDFCEKMRAEGKIKKLGFSFHDGYEVFESIITSRKWDFCQIQLNYMDSETQAGLKGVELAAKLGIPLVIMEPLKGGTLSELPESIMSAFTERAPGRSASSWSLRWLAAIPNITVVLSGMNSLTQLAENLHTMSTIAPFTGAERAAVAEVKARLSARVKNGCTGCRYCMPCPAGVDIPGVFRQWNEKAIYEGTGDGKNWRWSQWTHGGADKCVECGKCEEKCPQHLHIREDLKRASK